MTIGASQYPTRRVFGLQLHLRSPPPSDVTCSSRYRAARRIAPQAADLAHDFCSPIPRVMPPPPPPPRRRIFGISATPTGWPRAGQRLSCPEGDAAAQSGGRTHNPRCPVESPETAANNRHLAIGWPSTVGGWWFNRRQLAGNRRRRSQTFLRPKPSKPLRSAGMDSILQSRSTPTVSKPVPLSP